MRSQLLSITGLFLAASLTNVLAVATPAHAAPASPVSITSCAPVFMAAGGNLDTVPALVQYGVQITFVNTSAQTARDVTFAVGEDADATSSVVDHGTFAPGVAIRHVFSTSSDAAATCRVAAVTFANGTAYTSGEVFSAAR